MGHAFNQTIMDSLTRMHRMAGYNTLWLPGTDHAGIATQIVVERRLQLQGKDRHDLGRQAFIEQVWEWKHTSGGVIRKQMEYMGSSVDWSRTYFTMDQNLHKAVTEAFVRLYEEGLIYRGKRLVNWDPVLQSAVSDLEVEHTPHQGKIYYVTYPFVNGEQVIGDKAVRGMTIATTRPETMMADGALCVHPDDQRYQHLVGQLVELPLCQRNIPIIADDFVDPNFGSGCVKITGAHDFNDYACALRHHLPLITIFTKEAYINENAPKAYQGLARQAARTAVIKDLKQHGYLVDEKNHQMTLPICTRTNQVVEPMLTDQWFVAMNKPGKDGQSMSQKGIQVVKNGEVKFTPENWVNTYNQWMDSMEDWCISRQLWWGHQIPAWYDEEGHIYVGRNLAEAQSKAGTNKKLTQDEDVLDTWFSSALIPFSTMGWPQVENTNTPQKEKQEYDLFLPSSVLVTGYDIIFFWVARMVMMTMHFTGRVPFKNVYIHGLVRDVQGKKMSKSEGNVLDPVDLINGIDLSSLLEKRCTGLRQPETAPQIRTATKKEFPQGIPSYGADALRFTFASLASLGRNINFDTKRCEGYRNFCNKLWNATRFVLMHCENKAYHTDQEKVDSKKRLGFSHADRWIISRLQRVELEVAKGFTDYRLDQVANTLYQFVWEDFCDWYLEIAKVQLQHQVGNTPLLQQQYLTRYTLIRVLEASLRLLHPLIPFITEELWQKVAPVAGCKTTSSISIAPYPQAQKEKIDKEAENYLEKLKNVINVCRHLRSKTGVSPAERIPLYVLEQDKLVSDNTNLMKALAKLENIDCFTDQASWQQHVEGATIGLAGSSQLALKVKIDLATEQKRLEKEAIRLQQEITKAQDKLNNTSFRTRAPANIVEQEKKRLATFTTELHKIQAQQTRLSHTQAITP
jgi:valyl-tRNA synthetase